MEVPQTPIEASFFKFELKYIGKDSADPTQHKFQPFYSQNQLVEDQTKHQELQGRIIENNFLQNN